MVFIIYNVKNHMDSTYSPHRKKPPTGGYLLIDISSMMFHIVFACVNLFDKKCVTSCDKRTYILKYFKKLFINKIRSLIESHKTCKLVFARDVRKKEVWRCKIYDKYKAQRSIVTKHKGSEINVANYFTTIYRTLYDSIVFELDAITVKVPYAEADDVIMVLTQYLSLQEDRVVIVSDDNDYYQLLHYDKVEIYDTHGENFLNKIKDITPLGYLRLKILKGDKSDNISACQMLNDPFGILQRRVISFEEVNKFVKLGIFKIEMMDKDFAMDLQKDPYKIDQLCEADPLFRHLYHRNRHLIDMNHIPKDISQSIINKFLEMKPGQSIISH